MTLHSIRARLLIAGGGLTALALAGAWWLLSLQLAEFVERRIQTELRAQALGLMAAAGWDETSGEFLVDPPPADPRFGQPLSGWVWQIADGRTVLARSPSLLSADLGPRGTMAAADGQALILYHETFTAPGDGRPLIVSVGLPAAEATEELAALNRPLALTFALLALALMGTQIVAVRAGLVDLTRFARAVARLREGQGRDLPEPRTAELAPLAAELGRLIAANREQIARARAEAADLAHALKTPLAVLANRVGPADRAVLDRMERILRWHLTRARAAGRSADPAARAPVLPVLEDVALVLVPEARRRGVTLRVEAGDAPAFRGDAEDLAEMIGTLAENAVKWARGAVRLTARGEAGRLILEIADDGPGIPEVERSRLMTRGARLDQSGHGLGLAIAADRAEACGGRLILGEAPEGGLLARLELPAAGG